MATGAGKKQSREAKERTRLYRARQEFHDGLTARRRRDNLVAGLAGGILILAIIGGQVLYFTTGPGAPLPSPTPTATPTVAPTIPGAPQPTSSSTPEDPAPTPTPTAP
ncbi:MAG: dioxygenase [Microbacterium sp.]|uniref:dioxygenase n=1 Tax=Microbacterium sp. TaxID=51671 RepID=UPI001AC025E6|nr:dioxygenase [Microbacterium sp.]MBN9177232.1 dioxygenase [Microbacterium sp.]